MCTMAAPTPCVVTVTTIQRKVTMTRLIVLGASGSLGRHVLRQALAAGHEVTAFVRTPSKLPPEAQGRVSVHTGDLTVQVPP
jgi:nucleoside-diphosphate-sugar epimerase